MLSSLIVTERGISQEKMDQLIRNLEGVDTDIAYRILMHVRKYGLNGMDRVQDHPIFMYIDDPRVVRALLAAGTDVNIIRERDGSTLLMRICWRAYIEFIRHLLAHGVDVNKTNRRGFTALDCIIQSEPEAPCKPCMLLLVKHGAVRGRSDPDDITDRVVYLQALQVMLVMCRLKAIPKDCIRYLRDFLVDDNDD